MAAAKDQRARAIENAISCLGAFRTPECTVRGRKLTLGRRDSKPSVALVLQRSSTPSYTAKHPTDITARDFPLYSC